MLESTLIAAAQLFGTAARKLESFKPGTNLAISLCVKLPSRYTSNENPTLELSARFYSGGEYNTVKAASLAALMDEVYHRCGFDDKAALAIDATNQSLFTALEPPHTEDGGGSAFSAALKDV